MANVDQNNGYVALAANSSTGAAQAVKVDPSTSFLLIEVTPTSVSPTLNSAKVDQNNKWSAQAVDGNGVMRPLLIDRTSGYLAIDLLIV